MKNTCLTLCFWAVLLTTASAQGGWPPVYVIKNDTAAFSLDTTYFQALADPAGTLTLAQVVRSTGFRYGKQDDPGRRAHVYWLRMRLKNERPHAVQLYLSGFNDYVDLYWRDSGSRWQHLRAGILVPDSQLPTNDPNKENNRLLFRLAPGQEAVLYKRSENVLWNEPITHVSAEFETEEGRKNEVTYYMLANDGWQDFWFAGIAIGVLLLAVAYNLMIFFSTKERVYLYFSICLLFFVLDRNTSRIQTAFFGEYPYAFRFAATFFFIAYFIFFVQSVRRFAQPLHPLRSLNRAISLGLWLTVLINVLLILSFQYAVVSLTNMYLLLEVIIRVVYGLCLVLIYRMMKRNAADARYVFIAILPLFLWWSYTLISKTAWIYFAIYFDQHLPVVFQYAESFCFAWMIIFFSGALINRYNLTRRQVVQQAIEKEQLEKEREIERSRLITSQNERLEQQVRERTAELRQSLETLQATQNQLVQKEKLASLGELTAGIAHEIQNPLNFVNNFAEVSTELVDELREERTKEKPDETLEDEILTDLHRNLQKIHQHGQRAGAIVRGMLEHSRAGTGEKQLTDINALADEYLRLAYHGTRAKDKAFNCHLVTSFDPALPRVMMVTLDIGRVLLNLYNNAFYAVHQQSQRQPAAYQPTVQVSTRTVGLDQIEICVGDNGTGMPDHVRQKIFQPFFTTKPTGQGTGLGLSLSYDIITKGHGGELMVESQEGEGTKFIIRLPVKQLIL